MGDLTRSQVEGALEELELRPRLEDDVAPLLLEVEEGVRLMGLIQPRVMRGEVVFNEVNRLV